MSVSSRQLAAIMFTDMVGYTALMQKNEQLAIQQRDRAKEIFEKSLQRNNGKLLQYYGDGTLSVFTSGLNAVRSAIEIQTQYQQEPKVSVRIGIHTGDVMFDDSGIYGDSVNIASRIETLAVPGSVFISEKLLDEIKNQGIDAKPLGYFELKNVQQPVQVYAIANPGIIVPSRDEVKGKVKTNLNSIAVLPFASLSSDPENEFFCDGITEELLNVLSKVNGLQVTSRTSSFAFKGKQEDVREIAAKLNVQKVLEGSVRKAGNTVRITAQLINAADGYHIWSETYNRNLEDIFRVQDEISRAIANRLRENLSTTHHESSLIEAPTENLEAYRKYLEGVYLWNTQLPENIQLALNAFIEANRLDPSFASPYGYLAFLYSFMSYSGLMPAQESLDRCRSSALQAMEIDKENSQALLALAIVKLACEMDWEGAKECLDHSVSVNPNNSLAHAVLGGYYLLKLEEHQAIESLNQAHSLDPLGAFTGGLVAEFLIMCGKYDKAISVCDEVLKFNPENPYLLMMRYLARGFSGDWDKAIQFMERGKSMYGDFPILLGFLGLAYARTGNTDKAEEMLQSLLRLEKQQGSNIEQSALLYANLLYKNEYFERLEETIKRKYSGLIYYYRSSFLPEEISMDERFRKVRKEARLPL